MSGNIKSFVFFINLFFLCMGKERVGYPGYEFYPDIKGWLKFHEDPVDFRTARIICHNEAALLASPWTPAFITAVNSLRAVKSPSLPVMYSGAGLRKGSPGLPMEPCGNKRCSVFLANGVMSKEVCYIKLPFACFALATDLGDCGNGYEYNAELGQCYKFHNEGTTEPGARSICNSEGGYLAHFGNEAEKKFLMSRTSFSFIDNDGGGNAYRHLSSSSYSDYYCTGPHPFICEKNGPGRNILFTAVKVENDFRD